MKSRYLMLSLACLAYGSGCDREPPPEFQMTVDRVDVLRGFIMKGISITGEIKRGCIANEDEFVVTRKGKTVLKETVRIVSIEDLKEAESFNGKAHKGDRVTFYIPDGKKEDVLLGDVLTSNKISCNKNAVTPKKSRNATEN